MILRLLSASAAVAVLLVACAAPPPPAPAPAPAPKKKEKGKPAPAPAPTPARIAAAPAPPPSGPVSPSDQFKVTVDRSPFFNYGPQQPGGPSLSLEKGTVVTLLKRGFGYCQVRLKDQQVGFVGSEDIAALSAQEIAAAQNAGRPADMGALPPRPGGIKRASIPPLTFDELPKPEVPTTPKPEKKEKSEPKPDASPSPTPAFRY